MKKQNKNICNCKSKFWVLPHHLDDLKNLWTVRNSYLHLQYLSGLVGALANPQVEDLSGSAGASANSPIIWSTPASQ